MHARAGPVGRQEFVESSDGHRLQVRSWSPVDEPCAVLVVVPGFHSHGAYYERFAQTMARGNVATFALDLRGRGRSSGARCFVERFTEYVEDIEAVASIVRARVPARPLFLLGHGAGGVAACSYALANPRSLSGLICESFALETPASAALEMCVEALAFLAPRLPLWRLRSAHFSSDPDRVARMEADVLIRRERQPARTLAALFRANRRLRASLEDIALPLLILHGSADRIALPSGSQFFHEVSASRDKTLQIFEGYYHDLLNDRGSEHVVERVHDWMTARLDPTGDRAQIGISFINLGS